jgi:ribonuclease HI
MATGGLAQSFAYALVSAVPLEGVNATGIGIIFRGQDRSTVGTWREALPGADRIAATYEALMRVLEAALQARMRRVTIYTDVGEVVAQLTEDAEVQREVLVPHLKTRGMINQLRQVKLVLATSERFSARMVAETAEPAETEETPATSSRDGRQLSLLDAPAGT